MTTRDCKHGQLARVCNICELEAQVRALEKDAARLDFLLSRGLAWRNCYNEFWLKGEWLYREQKGRETIDTAMENTNG